MAKLLRRVALAGAIVAVALVLWKRFGQGPHSSTPGAAVTYVPLPDLPASSEPGSAESAAATTESPPVTTTDAPGGRSRRPVDVSALIEGPATWVPPVDGGAPPTHPVKVKVSSGIYHVPGGRSYDRTVPDRCYPDAEAAEADGYRRAKA